MKRSLVKFCGNRSLHDLQLATHSAADYIGIIFVKESKRYVAPHDLAAWLTESPLRDGQKLVGVFINPTDHVLSEVLFKIPLDIIQCHGHETPEQLLDIKRTYHLPVWKAIHHEENAVDLMKTFHGSADGYIIDNKKGNQLGGTGEQFDWTYIPEYLQEARRQKRLCFIAGGVNPTNLINLLTYQPDGIDLSSGIEQNQQKDLRLMKAIEEKVINHDNRT